MENFDDFIKSNIHVMLYSLFGSFNSVRGVVDNFGKNDGVDYFNGKNGRSAELYATTKADHDNDIFQCMARYYIEQFYEIGYDLPYKFINQNMTKDQFINLMKKYSCNTKSIYQKLGTHFKTINYVDFKHKDMANDLTFTSIFIDKDDNDENFYVLQLRDIDN